MAPDSFRSALIKTAWGDFLATFSEKGLKELRFPNSDHPRPGTTAARDSWIMATDNAVNLILQGQEPSELPPLDLAGTQFQQTVWRLLQKIPLGSTLSYSEVAARAGKPGAARAVGSACGANPIPLLIPCHRVLARGSRLGGFSGGLEWKERLLKAEGLSLV